MTKYYIIIYFKVQKYISGIKVFSNRIIKGCNKHIMNSIIGLNLYLMWSRYRLNSKEENQLSIKVELKSDLFYGVKRTIFIVKRLDGWVYNGQLILKEQLNNALLRDFEEFSLRVKLSLLITKLSKVISELTRNKERLVKSVDMFDVFMDYFKIIRILKDCDLVDKVEDCEDVWLKEPYWDLLKKRWRSAPVVRIYYKNFTSHFVEEPVLKNALYGLGLGLFHFSRLTWLNKLYKLQRDLLGSKHTPSIMELYFTVENIYKRTVILCEVLRTTLKVSENDLILKELFSSYTNLRLLKCKAGYIVVRGRDIKIIPGTEDESDFEDWRCYVSKNMEYVCFENDRKRYTLKGLELLIFLKHRENVNGVEELIYDIREMYEYVTKIARYEINTSLRMGEQEVNSIIDKLCNFVGVEKLVKEVVELNRFGAIMDKVIVSFSVGNMNNTKLNRVSMEYGEMLKLKKSIVRYWGLKAVVRDWRKELKWFQYRCKMKNILVKTRSRELRRIVLRMYKKWCLLNNVTGEEDINKDFYCTVMMLNGKRGDLYWRSLDWAYVFKTKEEQIIVYDITGLKEDYMIDGLISLHEQKMFERLWRFIFGVGNERMCVYWRVKLSSKQCYRSNTKFTIVKVILKFVIESIYVVFGIIIVIVELIFDRIRYFMRLYCLKMKNMWMVLYTTGVYIRGHTISQNLKYISKIGRYLYDKYVCRFFYIFESFILYLYCLWIKYVSIPKYVIKDVYKKGRRFHKREFMYYNNRRVLKSKKDLSIDRSREVLHKSRVDWYKKISKILENRGKVERSVREFVEEDRKVENIFTNYNMMGVTRAQGEEYLKMLYQLVRRSKKLDDFKIKCLRLSSKKLNKKLKVFKKK